MNAHEFKNACKRQIQEEAAKLSERILKGAFRKEPLDENYYLGVVKGMEDAAKLLDSAYGKAQKSALTVSD